MDNILKPLPSSSLQSFTWEMTTHEKNTIIFFLKYRKTTVVNLTKKNIYTFIITIKKNEDKNGQQNGRK